MKNKEINKNVQFLINYLSRKHQIERLPFTVKGISTLPQSNIAVKVLVLILPLNVHSLSYPSLCKIVHDP